MSGFTAKQQKVAIRLASGWTMRAAATEAGITYRTVHRWRQEPEFLALIERHRGVLIDRTLNKLAGAASKAVKTLQSCLDSSESDSIRVRSALGILDQLIRIRDVTELERRMAEIERKMTK
jgi:hypothetical protein